MGRVSWFASVLVLAGVLLSIEYCSAGGGPKNVLLVVNDNSQVSQRIAAYYKEKRGIPDRNVCHIQCSTDESVTKSECENNIVIPIRNFINTGGIHSRIDYIVLTKGIPLKASYNDGTWFGPVSVTSVLTCVGVPSIVSFSTNPYGPMAYPAAPVQYFTHQLSFSGRSFYVVTRLDAYTEGQVYRMIDDSVGAQSQNGLFLMDGRYESDPNTGDGKANGRLRQANHDLLAAGFSTYYDDTTFDSMITEFVGGRQDVMGYYSWGSNEPSYTFAAYLSNYFRPGSIADSYVSSSARSFTAPPSYGQSLIADLIPQGLSAGNGYVSEPDVKYATYPNVLFSRYTLGYNMGESFLAGTPRLYWKSATVGDPLMAPYATPPTVMIANPGTVAPVHGTVSVTASATNTSGIKKMELYIDDQLLYSVNGSLLQFSWNTLGCSEGAHLLEVIAYENSSVCTQGSASALVQVRNIPQDVATISQLAGVPFGSLVRLASKTVTAGTNAFVDCAYIAEPDRSAGIKIQGAFQVETGDIVTVAGELDLVDGERTIKDATVTLESAPEPPMAQGTTTLSLTGEPEGPGEALYPLGMPNKFVANRGDNSDPEYAELRVGLSNAALLVKTWGRVTEAGADHFTISDGSLVKKNAPIQGVEVSLRNLATPIEVPAVGAFVVVSGISCYTLEDGLRKPTVRPRSESDIQVVPP